MKKIAFFNNKGGCGKSTATINVAHVLSLADKLVIVCDCDNQKNTFRFFADKPESDSVETTRYEKLDVALGASRDINSGDYDYAIFDLPSALDERTKQIVSSCDYVFVPIELGTFSIQGIANVTESIAATGAKFGGCFANKFDRKNPADLELDALLRTQLGNKAMTTRIPYSRVIKNSISYRLTALEYMSWTNAAAAYSELTKEILSICEGV
jgi:chromosome partitioning protein